MYRHLFPQRPVRAITLLVITGLLAGGWAVPVAAEETRIPVMSQSDRTMRSDLPRQGQSQDGVRQRFGAPASTRGPTGEPPISQWLYDDFVVYFEYDHVIHSVVTPE